MTNRDREVFCWALSLIFDLLMLIGGDKTADLKSRVDDLKLVMFKWSVKI